MRHEAWHRALGIGMWLAFIATTASATQSTRNERAPGSNAVAAPTRCEGAVQHPLTVRIQALDPIERGALVRLRLVTTTRITIGRTEARLVDAGGAGVAGPTRASLGRISARREAAAEFRVTIPQQGQRFLVQFQVTGEGASGPIQRGATYNVLPDGPADAGRVVTTESGQVLEYRARRIDQ